jgi:hypothetical protein
LVLARWLSLALAWFVGTYLALTDFNGFFLFAPFCAFRRGGELTTMIDDLAHSIAFSGWTLHPPTYVP